MMFRICFNSLCLGSLLLVALVFNPINITSGHQELNYNNEDVEGLTINSNSDQEDNSVSTQDSDEANKFSWKNHQSDHSIFAHRSLMSTENIQHHKNEKTDESVSKQDDDEYEFLQKIDYAEKEWQLMFRSFDLMYDSVSASMLQEIGRQTNLFEEIVGRLKPECKRDIYHIRESVKKHKLWALRMLDSNGKIPSGITYGRLSSPGDYEECLSVNVNELVYKEKNAKSPPEQHKFRGKYCLIDFRLPLPERPKDKLLSVYESVLDLSKMEIAKEFPDFKNYSGYASVFYEVGYMHALCLPSTCDVFDLTKSMGIALEGLHLIVNNTVDCEVKADRPEPLRTSQIISITLLVILFLNASLASIVHSIRSRNKQKSTGSSETEKSKEALLLEDTNKSSFKTWATEKIKRSGLYSECFSIQTNLNRLTKPDPRGLAFVHYTRIVAMGLTVITHTAGLGTLQAITKPTDTSNSEQIFRDFIPQMLANAFTSIQIFFFMAGFMLVISTYPSINREKGHLSFIEYAIKRAIRLMPGIAATICLNFLWPLFVDGPMLSYFIRLIVIPCETNWWRTLGFLSNFDHVEKMCLRHSYFSASDYQLHLMAFPLLILLYRQPFLALSIAGILTVAGFAAQVIMILTKTVLPFMMIDYIDKEAFFNVVHYIHHPVWNHMSAFFYGFIIGYLVVKQVRINLSATTIKRLWIIILPAGIASIFAPYFWNHYKRPIFRWQMVLYVIFDRFILLTTCAWLSYATMVLGRKPPCKKPKDSTKVNLPDIISLEKSKQEELSQNLSDPSQNQSLSSSTKFAGSSLNLQSNGYDSTTKQAILITGIPRQRSSPNFLASKVTSIDEEGSTTLRLAKSNMNVSNPETEQREQVPKQTPEVNTNRNKQPKKCQAPVTNVNTLCLILSRLTFQLYLFNMVVLWVDVNNSKYPWFFSYYFIITKAFAVYICSSLMAMVFFITLESPCLTLYIMWVKSRAQLRANRSTEADQEINKRQPSYEDRGDKLANVEKSIQNETSYDGLCMRSNIQGPTVTSPSFSFIDLSTPPTSDLNQNCPKTNQTRM